MQKTMARETVARSAESTGGLADGTSSIFKVNEQQPRERKLVYTGSITLRADKEKHSELMNKIAEFTKNKKGYIANQTLDYITFKVPAADFQEAFQFVRTLAEVDSESVNVQDITDQYTDNEIRLENAEKLQKRLMGLLDKSGKVEEMVSVERELSRVTEQIEMYKGRQRLYENQISFSTLSVYLSRPSTTRPGPLGYVFYYAYLGLKWLFVWD